jgi:hypothetical protein
MTSVPTEKPVKPDTTANAFLAAMLIAAAVTGVASLSAAGTGALQQLLRFAGVGRTTVLEQEQQRQAAVIAELERILNNVQVDLGSVDVQARLAQTDASGVNGRLARIDTDIGSLRDAIAKRSHDAEIPQNLRQSMLQSDKVVHGALSELASLRSTIDTNETAYKKEFATINQRLDRLERTLTGHDITSSVQRKPVRKQVQQPAPSSSGIGEYLGAPVLPGDAAPDAGRQALTW